MHHQDIFNGRLNETNFNIIDVGDVRTEYCTLHLFKGAWNQQFFRQLRIQLF